MIYNDGNTVIRDGKVVCIAQTEELAKEIVAALDYAAAARKEAEDVAQFYRKNPW